MEVCHTLICFFFLFSLQDGNTGLVSAQLSVYSVTEGAEVRVECSFPSNRIRKVFCKEPCEQEDILIETTDFSAQRGRYRIDYKLRDVFVTISQLTKSDSGKYRCGVGPSSGTSYEDIEILVVDALTTSPKTTEQPETTKGVILYVRLTLVVLVIVSSLSVLVFCRKRICKAKSEEPEPPVETQYDFITETDRVYDDIVEAGRSRSPPVEISSVHTHVRYTRPHGDETEDY